MNTWKFESVNTWKYEYMNIRTDEYMNAQMDKYKTKYRKHKFENKWIFEYDFFIQI